MSPCSQRGRHWKSFERAKWRAWSIWRISLDLLRELWEFLFIFADFWLFLVIWLKLPWWFSILPGTTGMIYSFCQVKPPSCFMWRPGIYSGSIHIPWPGPKDQTDEVNIDQRSRVFGTKVWLSLWPSKYLTLYTLQSLQFLNLKPWYPWWKMNRSDRYFALGWGPFYQFFFWTSWIDEFDHASGACLSQFFAINWLLPSGHSISEVGSVAN
jgi:hypothetical protein